MTTTAAVTSAKFNGNQMANNDSVTVPYLSFSLLYPSILTSHGLSKILSCLMNPVWMVDWLKSAMGIPSVMSMRCFFRSKESIRTTAGVLVERTQHHRYVWPFLVFLIHAIPIFLRHSLHVKTIFFSQKDQYRAGTVLFWLNQLLLLWTIKCCIIQCMTRKYKKRGCRLLEETKESLT